MKKLLDFINRLNPVAVIFIVLICNRLGFNITGGEEQYLLYAKHFFNNSFVPGSFLLNDFPGTKLFFQVLTGPFLGFISLPVFAFIGRFIVFFCISFPLTKIFKTLGLSNLHILIIVQAYIFAAQSFFAHEWIVWDFQPKAIAYIFVLWALYFMLENKYSKSLIFSAIAIHFHYLVGGWFAVLLFIYWILTGEKLKDIVLRSLKLGIMILPLTIYLYLGIIRHSPEEINGINLNWIYCYYRLPHHIGIFNTYEYFFKKHFIGVLISSIILIICIIFHNKMPSKNLKSLNTLNIIMLSIVLAFVMVALIDKIYFDRTCRMFLKYYPFRLNALTRLMAYTEFVLLIYTSARFKNLYWVRYTMMLLILMLLLSRLVKNVKHNFTDLYEDDYYELTDYIKNTTSPGSVFAVLDMNAGSSAYISFMRLAERESFSVVKFVPAGTERVYYWYMRSVYHNKLNRNIDFINQLPENYKLDYIVTQKPREKTYLEEIFSNKKYYLYKILN